MLESFDVISYLEERDVPYYLEGKNVTRGWVNITCPYCGDHSNHLGVSLETKFFNCWRCGEKGPASKLIQELEQCSWAEANTVIHQYQDKTFEYLKRDIRKRHEHPTNILPKEAGDVWAEIQLEYLRRRGFQPDHLIQTYKLKACGPLGQYKFRIIVPIVMNNTAVSFTTINIVEKGYKHCPNDVAIVPTKECLYNVDSVTDKVIIVEGVTDVWRLGSPAVAVFGVEYTSEQINLLFKKRIEKAVVVFDAEPLAQKKADKLATQLSALIPEVTVEELEEGDPADLSPERAMELKQKWLN